MKNFYLKNQPMFAGLTAGLVILLVCGFISFLLYRLNSTLQFNLLRDEIENIAKVATLQIDIAEQKKYTDAEQTSSDDYLEDIKPLVDIHKSVNNILYIYTMREIDGELYYVFDTANVAGIANTDPSSAAEVMEHYPYNEADPAYQNWMPKLRRGEIDVDEEFYQEDGRYILSASIPLFDDLKFFGLLGIDYDVSVFEAKRKDILEVIFAVMLVALLISIIVGHRVFVISNRLKAVHKELYIQAHTDFLTGAYNRRYFIDQLEKEISRAFRYKTPLSLLLLDIDHFKQVNDTHGHVTGDDVLIELVSQIKRTIRKSDMVARLGGEEFSLLLTNTDIDGAMILADRLVQQIEAVDVISVDGVKFNFTISVGVSELTEQLDLDKWLHQSDEALYHAKTHGRNQACNYHQLTKVPESE